MIKVYGKAKEIKIIETFKSFEKTTLYKEGKIISVDRVYFEKERKRAYHPHPINKDETARIIFLANLADEELKKNLRRQKAINSAERYLRFENRIGLIALEMGRSYYSVKDIVKNHNPEYNVKFQGFGNFRRKKEESVLSMKEFVFKLMDSRKDKKSFQASIPSIETIEFLKFWDTDPEKLIFTYLQKIGKKISRKDFDSYVSEYIKTQK